VQEWKEQHDGKPPDKIEKYYDRLDVVVADEEDEKEEDKGKGKKKEKEAKKEAKGKKGKGKGAEKEKKSVEEVGPTEVVQKFEMQYEEYENIWAKRDETNNYEQAHDKAMLRQEILPIVEKGLQKTIDQMLDLELENMRTLMGAKKKKGKKKKGKKKKGKKKKGKKIKLPGYKQISKMTEYEMLIELVKNSIVKRLPTSNLKDFLGEFNYIASMMDNPMDQPRPPSMALIRQLVTEYIVFPLGSDIIRKRHPEHTMSFLFYGPAGTGKTQIVRAVSTETRAIVYDISPQVIKDCYNADKKEGEKLVALVMVAAKKYGPSIIYIDECEKIFAGKKKKKKGEKKAKKKGNDPNNP
jgi:SpoVK/Ycf46/Vps4 family AAA+-type ATPase